MSTQGRLLKTVTWKRKLTGLNTITFDWVGELTHSETSACGIPAIPS